MKQLLLAVANKHNELVENGKGSIPFAYILLASTGILAAGWAFGVLTTIKNIEKNPEIIENWEGFENVEVTIPSPQP